jgi:hypothetical protein
MTDADKKEASLQIQQGLAEHLFMHSRRASVWRVVLHGQPVVVFYSKRRNSVTSEFKEKEGRT